MKSGHRQGVRLNTLETYSSILLKIQNGYSIHNQDSVNMILEYESSQSKRYPTSYWGRLEGSMSSTSVYNVGGLSLKYIELMTWPEAKGKFGNTKSICHWTVECESMNQNQFDVVKTEVSSLNIDILRVNKRNELELFTSFQSRSRQGTITLNKILSKTVLRFNPHPNDIH